MCLFTWLEGQPATLTMRPDALYELGRAMAMLHTLARRFPTGNDRPDRVYDQQDAFYLPLAHLDGLTRPGPAFDLYRRTSQPKN